MPVDEAITGVLGGAFRFFAWFFMEVFFQSICWSIGWVTLKIFTVGVYPKQETNTGYVIAVGIIVLMISIIGLVIYLS